MGRLLNHYPKNIGKFYLLIIRKINHRKRPQIINQKFTKNFIYILTPHFHGGYYGGGYKSGYVGRTLRREGKNR